MSKSLAQPKQPQHLVTSPPFSKDSLQKELPIFCLTKPDYAALDWIELSATGTPRLETLTIGNTMTKIDI